MSSVSFSYGWNYDVFLSFRGSDTRHGFTGHLYKALCDRGIHTFIDDEELQRGEEITPSLLKAIQESRIAIPVFSKNYASSTFCLDELVSILACFKEKGRLVLPVFYDVDPSHVRHQIGNYEEALNSHKERFNDQEKLQKWKIALRQVADLSGYHFKHGGENEYEFIGKIVIEVSQKINRTLLHVADYPVGLESPLLQVNSLLNIESGGVHVVGIYGIGGVGKTTIARAIYNLIADQFEGLCFLDNVRETSIKHGLVHLQEAILSKSIGEDGIKLGSVNEGIPIIKHRLHLKKVLLVLDDVDKLDQLQATVGGTDWFGSGSRIIITTRDRHLLKSHGVEKTYEVDMLNKKDAFKLLSWSAFKTDKVDSCYQNILNRVVTFTSGLPLALEVIGSNLFGKRIEEWESALDRYERIPNKKIQDILRVSFDSLEEDEQDIFLDIACCFKGYALTYVKEILSNHHGFRPEYGIGVLIDKSLVKIDACGCVTLHDLIEDMGKEIVRKESPEEPGKRSRLWCPEDIVEVLEENKGTKRIQIINLDYLKYEVEWNGMGFKEMTNLKTLIIRDAIFTNGPKHLPNSLRVLEWWRYPSSSLPFEFHPKKLVILRLPYSCFCSRSLDLFMSKKELHEAGGCKEFCLPGTRIPEWFEHCTNGSSISFWFRNKFPAISVCAVIKPREYMDIWPVFTFNGKKQLSGEVFYLNHVADHLVIFDQKQKSFDMRGILWENEWHHVECTIDPPKILVEKIGIHVFKQGSNMEDIEFTNPQLLIEEDFSNLFTYLGF
ncbi:TMV resistance protein N isoform X3 [Cajanus cajan]|uniref:TMV resistance protein N isoform X3 n=1 Tax=Cajanus cajan TaxID=3821 RepID=UPI00098DCF8F|nr:TMV resistance protein N isoform X3 [Cajanus cajan]